MNVVFLHPVFTPEALAGHDVSSHAANVWCRSLYDEMLRQKINLSLVGHVPARIWPLGKRLRLNQDTGFSADFRQINVPYLNFPLLRTAGLCRGYRAVVRRLIKADKGLVLCTYNPLPWQVSAAAETAARGHPWISFVLDDDTISEQGWSRYLASTALAMGHIFVSKWAFDHAPVEKKFLFEGGVSQWLGEDGCGLSLHPSFLFCGQIGDAVDEALFSGLLEASHGLDFELWVSGRGQERLASLAAKDSRLKLLGFLDENQLHHRLQAAWGFINLRQPNHRGACMNFPSKLFLYLSYGKPIVSMYTPGIPDCYRSVIRFTDDSGENNVGEIRKIIDMSLARRQEFYKECRRFVMRECWMENKVRDLWAFVETVVQARHS